ncbi:MAG: PglZ domain-containing protein [Blastochloris sp.]|nr:PglZ domain-containing protein [Blastochloris sp.]
MITVIADRHGCADPPTNALTAAAITDYVAVRRRIQAALDQGKGLTVYVTDPVVIGWLSDLRRYPESYITWQVVDPGEQFFRMFGVTPAEPFTLSRIAALQLSELPHPPVGMAVHPLTWILGQRLDPVWQHDIPPLGHVTSIIEWAISQQPQLDPQLIPIVQAQLDRWIADQPIYSALHAGHLTTDSENLLLRWALQRYNADWCSTQPWSNLPILDREPTPALLISVLKGQHPLIQSYWNRQIATVEVDGPFIVTALAQMSGFSDVELQTIQMAVDRNPDVLDRHLFQVIKRRFTHLPGAHSVLSNLAEKVAPSPPVLPNTAWKTEDWLRWATEEYIPYYAWIIRTGRGREYQQQCALLYSDWLYKEYAPWLDRDPSPLIMHQYRDVTAILDNDEKAVVFWLVIDGLTWWQGEIIRNACAKRGLYTTTVRPAVAILPTITSVSKRVLVTGQPIIDVAETGIADAARMKLSLSCVSAWVGSNLTQAHEELQNGNQSKVFVILINQIDTLSHNTSNFTDSSVFRGLLDGLIEGVVPLQQICATQGRRFHMLIGSDHGSTILPESAISLSVPSAVHEVEDSWETEQLKSDESRPRTRAATTHADSLPSVDPEVWYTLDRDRFQLDRHYLVPRGYNYIKRRPSGWTHGGLSPEETIVPLLHVISEIPTILPLDILLQGTLRAGQSGILTLIIQNINTFPVEQIVVTVTASTDSIEVARIEGLAKATAEIHIPMVTVSGTELPVTYEVQYYAFGNSYQTMGKTTIAVRRLQVEDTSFDDMFN